MSIYTWSKLYQITRFLMCGLLNKIHMVLLFFFSTEARREVGFGAQNYLLRKSESKKRLSRSICIMVASS